MAGLNILYIMDPIDKIDIDKDSTFAMMEAAQARGHQNHYALPQHLFYKNKKVYARSHPIEVTRQQAYYSLAPERTCALGDMDAVLMRKDPPFNMDYIFCTYLLELATAETLVLNRPDSLRNANEKLYSLHFPTLIPDTLVSANLNELKSFIREMEQAIIKPIDNKGGSGILLVRHGDANTNSMLDLVTLHGERMIVAQRFIPEARQGDKRVIFVDGEIKGHFIRVPSSEDHRGNLSAGALAQKCELTTRDLEICETLSPALRRDGLYFTGIDLIGGYLIEINVTSPTGIQEVRKLSGNNIAEDIIEFLEKKVNR